MVHDRVQNNDTTVRLTGFQRWFCGVVAQGIPIRYLAYGCHAACAIWSILILAAIVFTIGWLWKLPLIVLLIAAVVLYVALVRQGHQMAADPSTPLEWYQRPFWLGLLKLSRLLKWSGYDPGLKDRKVVDLRLSPINDAGLPKVEGLQDCEVLDLEGAPITDQSVATIEQLKGLKCLVVCNTRISDAGVSRIQQRNPGLWIWH